ncbi:DUF6197 family protein [Stackebrandtia nassauensis]|uniref:Uncharacterized protein n=1 Tax=Stackebrandtia nassauensis (strain DSM 44728 / CIP 108903 / NRRL B-16338 / NBRC 102104 / LLR-40K-21) TaxID=446470 RepID=D3Q3Z5_STANL|nr:hypothetical protein [Stackebrandtia nassauensis]ADD45880.1 hypothetical protein Snas_6260 [Stackebrandtia nassauensis DSM 44728]
MTYQNPTIREVLNAAADLIEEHGLEKGHFVNNGRYDARGAIAKAIGLHVSPAILGGDMTRYSQVVLCFARHMGLADEFAISDWDSHPDRTPAQVVTALRAAANEAPND